MPRAEQNQWNAFAIRAVRKDDEGNITAQDQVNCNIFIQGRAPAPIPNARSAFLEASVPSNQLPASNGQRRSFDVEATVVDGADVYGIYWKDARYIGRDTNPNTVVFEDRNVPFTVIPSYTLEDDGRYRLTGGRISGTLQRTAGGGSVGYNITIEGIPVPQDYPESASLPAVSIPTRTKTVLGFENRDSSLAANRLFNQTRNLFTIRPSDLGETSGGVSYSITAGTPLPVNKLLVTPKPFASFRINNLSGVYWIEFEGEPSIEQYGRYEVPLTITRSISQIRAGDQTKAEPAFLGSPGSWTHSALGTMLVRVADGTPAPTTENFRNAYRIFINEFWESDPFLASNIIGDPIEITFVNAPDGFEVTEDDDGFRFHWTPTREQAGVHEIEVHITANPGVEGEETATLIAELTINVITNRGHITQIENPSSIREFGEQFERTPPFFNWQFLEYGLRNRHVVPPRTILMSFPIDLQMNDFWREVEPGRVIALNIFNVMDRPSNFVVDKVTIQDVQTGNAYKNAWLTEQKTCLLYTSPSPRDRQKSRMPSSA